MKRMKSYLLLIAACMVLSGGAAAQFSSDVIATSRGDLEMFFIGHGTLMFKFNGMVIHIDPTMREADYSALPDADLVFVTHHHGDHLDPAALNHIVTEATELVMPPACLERLEDFEATALENGEEARIGGIGIRAVPAYNIKHTRSSGEPFHPKGVGNAYLLSFGDTNVLIGGDTENVPEIKALEDVDVAFLPMNLPYTMTPEMVADAARAIRPSILYPYHFGNTDPAGLVELLKEEEDIEVRIRDLK